LQGHAAKEFKAALEEMRKLDGKNQTGPPPP
jgi:hypothetical protein